MVNYTISNPISFGGLQNYTTSSNTNLFTMLRPPNVGYHPNSSELGFFYFKDSIMKSENHETLV